MHAEILWLNISIWLSFTPPGEVTSCQTNVICWLLRVQQIFDGHWLNSSQSFRVQCMCVCMCVGYIRFFIDWQYLNINWIVPNSPNGLRSGCWHVHIFHLFAIKIQTSDKFRTFKSLLNIKFMPNLGGERAGLNCRQLLKLCNHWPAFSKPEELPELPDD